MFQKTNRKRKRARRSRNYIDVISINFDRLQLHIQAYVREVERGIFWLTPAGVFLSLFTALLVSDFKDKFGIKGSDWRTATIILCAGFALWTALAFLNSIRRRNLDKLMDEISESSVAPLRHYGIPIFRSKDRSGVAHILVYRDEIWGCYLCPYVGLQPDQMDPEDVSEPAADRFGLPKEALRAHEMESHEIRTSKKSESSQKFTNYRFVFYLMTASQRFESTFSSRTFKIQGRAYRWMTVEEALADIPTANKNGDVLRYIRDNRPAFFHDKLPLSIKRPIGD